MSLLSNGGGNELMVTGTGACSLGYVEQICTGHKRYKAQLSPPLLILCFAVRASQERLSAERAPKHGYNAAGDWDCSKVCEASGSIASLAVSRRGTNPSPSSRLLLPTTPAGKPGTDCYEANAS
ncbi:unnamed protein product [Pleuronectes platessa]|uniref:Uncharacterized protein n=1 Tax=Pleuronectes platessa TaxID=8262 RepID=A0A9N7Z3D8_PLEPL|nr:unnamed protein product [Pleuronectes platessa]